jgi:hypothetical protein
MEFNDFNDSMISFTLIRIYGTNNFYTAVKIRIFFSHFLNKILNSLIESTSLTLINFSETFFSKKTNVVFEGKICLALLSS